MYAASRNVSVMTRAAAIRRLQRRLSEQRIIVECDDESVRATVDGHGSLLDLEIREDAVTRQNASHLEKSILLTIRRAELAVERLHRKLAKALPRDGERHGE